MKDKIVYLVSDPTESDNVGAFLRAGDDGDPISSTNIGGKEGLDVNIINTSLISAGAYLEDSAAVSGDYVVAAGVQRHDANTSTVSADGDYSLLHVNSLGGLKASLMSAAGKDLVINDDGSINVQADISVVTGSDKVEDVAAANADVLTAIAVVRQDVLSSSVSADGDYGWAKMDVKGALWTNPTPNGAIATSAVTVPTTEILAPTVSLAARRRLFIQNLAKDHDVYLGNTGVTTSTGFQISRGSTWEFEMGPAITPYLIGSAGTSDIRTLQIGA